MPRPFGEILLQQGRIDSLLLDEALRLQQESSTQGRPWERLGTILLRLGAISTSDIAHTLAAQYDLPLATPADFPEIPTLEERVSTRFLREVQALPLWEDEETLTLAVVDPGKRYTIDAFVALTGRNIELKVATPEDMEAAYERLYGNGKSAMGQIVDDLPGFDEDRGGDDVEQLKDLASEAPVIRLVGLILRRALDSRASDIHIEPFEQRLFVRYRIDGVIHEQESPPRKLSAAIISRIKIMASLDIAERRLPQDGRIKLSVTGKEVDLRVSTVPTMHGESVVMRVLDKGNVRLDFASLGFDADMRERFTTLLGRPHGVLLVTGPTGSGKTTSLYAALGALNTSDRKILTVEDPVEYQIEGINQIQVKPQIGLSFANALRSIVRQDPDVIMIGEIRDLETAQIAVQSALTGHLVLSTLHTNDAASTINRLLDMGIEDYLLASTLIGVQAQRLVRTLCPSCRAPYPATAAEIAALGELAETRAGGTTGAAEATHTSDEAANDEQATEHLTLYQPVGCPACAGTGFLGRIGIMEIMLLSESLRSLVMRQATPAEIERAAIAEGMLSMYAHGLRKVAAGQTTLGEVLRVTRGS